MIVLDRNTFDGIRTRPGPHPVGTVEQFAPGELRIKVFDTQAGREARALLEDDLVDIRVDRTEIHLE